MNKSKKQLKAIDFQEYLAEQLKNPEFKRHYDEHGRQLEIAYQILQLRKKKKMTQAELAKRIGTKQSNVARMEAGNQNFTIDILQRIASVLGKNLKIEFTK
ncbi:helix-turn-helix transcriptional regulator [Patescibacteria group bacterium]|nr:helix-turn-helix transcriptional regulator [Patescibacteria group bacterium]MBU1563976.1 helix-turn-helix transcriptional regulator [Patescibacteria group bacterium]MBU2068376.1 helix-turn-helix transcriptional regulator [Patescibacteria group bacterium]